MDNAIVLVGYSRIGDVEDVSTSFLLRPTSQETFLNVPLKSGGSCSAVKSNLS